MGDSNYENVYAVRDVLDPDGRKVDTKWVRIGVMFENRDGTHTIKFEALPLDWTTTTIITRRPRPRDADFSQD